MASVTHTWFFQEKKGGKKKRRGWGIVTPTILHASLRLQHSVHASCEHPSESQATAKGALWRAWRSLGGAADVDLYVSGELGAVLEDSGEEEAAGGGGRLLAACNRRWRGGAKSSGWNSSLFPVPFSVRARADRPSGSSEAHRRAALLLCNGRSICVVPAVPPTVQARWWRLAVARAQQRLIYRPALGRGEAILRNLAKRPLD